MNRAKAAIHEIRCQECRVTWMSWAQRIVGIPAGMTPKTARPVVEREVREVPFIGGPVVDGRVSAVTARPFKGDTGTVRLKILDGWVTLTYTGELHIDLTRDFCVGGVESSDSSIYCESSWIE